VDAHLPHQEWLSAESLLDVAQDRAELIAPLPQTRC